VSITEPTVAVGTRLDWRLFMFTAPDSADWFGRRLTRQLAERIARDWWVLLVEGLLSIVAGVLIFSIDWSVRSLATFIGTLLILHGASTALIRGLDRSARAMNLLSGLASTATGVAIIVWPAPGLVAVGIVLGAWLIVIGTVTITGAFAGRDVIPDWWMWLVLGLLEIPLGVLALADPGATLAALITASGIWAVATGVTYVVMAFRVKRLPERVDAMMTPPNGTHIATATPRPRSVSTAS
jgi:uncharacterized membrane protein HdeD (DUF308 family)